MNNKNTKKHIISNPDIKLKKFVKHNFNQEKHIGEGDQDYDIFTSRNYHFITPEIQKQIKNTTLCFLGCGLGANIALLAARLGFRKFLLYDFDTIELSNLNRQPFFCENISEKKVDTLKKYLSSISPDIEIISENRKIDLSFIKDEIEDFDFCINTIDFGKDYVDITDCIAFQKKKTVLLPMNIGFGSFVMAFNNESKSFDSLIQDNNYDMFNIIMSLIEKSEINLPNYISPENIFVEIMEKKYDPQLGLASSLTGSLVNSIVIKMLKQEPVKLSPQAVYVDINNHLTQATGDKKHALAFTTK
ncbi:ThiF family adenylyltransferase [Candidatus Margulisiibacteriota bacterium]